MTILIKGGHVINPATQMDEVADVLIEDQKIKKIGKELPEKEAERVINADGCYVMPGFIDMHVHFRDPGFEQKEDIYTGMQAAAHGGYTTVLTMPNTKPVADNPDIVNYVHNKAKSGSCIHVLQVGAVTKGQQGKELAVKKIKTVERDKRTIKTGRTSEQVVKNTGKGTIKTSGKAVKTAEQTARTSIKTSEQIANASVQAMHYSMKKAEKAVQAARQTAQNTRIAVKTTAKAVTHAIKALIEATKALLSALTAGGWIAVMILIIVILFGGFLCMTGGDNSSTVSSVSAEVEAYEPLIRQYANQYGIGEYVELIKAIMMQESGGRGLDPMQCSEGSFNTKYPKQPNGITDPEYSISCGVQEIKSCLERAGVKNPLDMENIKLALQSYNYGNGYLEWAKARGGYTLANAAEFSDMMAQRMGWSSYGDKQYVPHVLQYYAFGRIPTGIGNQAIVQVAASQEGKGGTTYWSWYGFGGRVEWCACFVSWCADQSGYIQSGVIPKFSLCSDGVKWFESKGRFRDGSYTPVAGDIIFFDWGNNGTIDHVGIVESVNGGTVNTIEGNSGDKVARRSYRIGSSNIYGYGVPAY